MTTNVTPTADRRRVKRPVSTYQKLLDIAYAAARKLERKAS